MSFSSDSLRHYLHAVTGVAPLFEPASPDLVSRLPLYLRERYQWRCTRLFDHELLFALEKSAVETPDEMTPGDLVQHADTIRKTLGQDAIFVLHPIPSFLRNRLVQSRISFIVPGSQMFLPDIPADLREYFPRRRDSPRDKLLVSAQVIVLFQLVKGGLDGLCQREIAGAIGYSGMMVSHARDQLEALEFCEVEKQGRSISLRFHLPRRELWERSKEMMSSPVQKVHWITGAIPAEAKRLAGISALSKRTLLGEDTLPTFAIFHKSFLDLLNRGEIHGRPLREEAEVQVEAWRYDPRPTADRGMVDVFSLYLSLESEPDDRIQQELGHLMEEIQW